MHMTQEGILPPLCLAQKYKPVKFFLIQSAIQTASNDGLQPDEQGSEVGVTCDEEKSDGEQDVVTAGNRLKEIRNRHDTNSEAVSELVGKQGQNGADRRQKSAKKISHRTFWTESEFSHGVQASAAFLTSCFTHFLGVFPIVARSARHRAPKVHGVTHAAPKSLPEMHNIFRVRVN
jgi:hypothetical protein